MPGSEALDEARRDLFWKLQGARSHMQGMRESADAFAVYDDLIRAEQAATIQSMREALEKIALLHAHSIECYSNYNDPANQHCGLLDNSHLAINIARAALASLQHQEER